MSFKFFGGIHPNDKKSPSNKAEATRIAQPPEVVIPMSLHIGAPCSPLVAVGDEVKLGQKIGDAQSPVSAPIHASVSGVVKKIEPRLHSNGVMVNSIVIENDGLNTPCETMVPATAEQRENPEEIIKIIREAGIVGMGGATFPTAFKISSGKGKVNTVVINGAECEPYITSDHRTMLECPDEVITGVMLIMKACEVTKCYFGIEENKADAIEVLKQKNPANSGIEIVTLPCMYPQGAEKQLVQSVTGLEIPPGGLPAAVGCAVFNAYTAYSIYRAVYEGFPAVQRLVTVSGSAVKDPKNLIVPVGTPVEYVFEQAGGMGETPKKVLMGGPMMGNALYNLTVGTTKGTNALLAFSADEDQTVDDPQCIRCGKCATVCPMKLSPLYLYIFEQRDDFDKMSKYNLTDCIECGACTYNCPAKLHLTHSCRTGKAKIMAKANEEKARLEAEKAKAEAEKEANK